MTKGLLLFSGVWRKPTPRGQAGSLADARPPYLEKLPLGESLPHLHADRWGETLTWTGVHQLPADTLGVPWSEVDEAWWNPQLMTAGAGEELRYAYHQLRVTLSVVNGTPGDGVAFALRCGAGADSSAPIGITHLDVVGEAIAGQVKRSTVVNTFFLPGYGLRASGAEAFATIRSRTHVTIIGMVAAGSPEVLARVEIIGGFVEEDVPGR
jgi:hypothetical protein